MTQSIQLQVNGRRISAEVDEGELLIDFLRNQLQLTGTKEACSIGICGLCTVLVNGKAISSCLMPAVFAHEANVFTAEGLRMLTDQDTLPEAAPDPRLWAIVQETFVECEGLQCGICTPGQVMSAVSLLREHPDPTEEEIRRYMAGNLCRCTGYLSIIRAIQLAAQKWGAERAVL
ncbi:(2Fe-2S)-binding protein [Paenibacillus validus]|uniref:(2Fe-2S)-binding protein n=1 Tax=Paenibacillus TaxID=44249 RepID=UPI0006CF7EC6|nr:MULTISPECIES: (2Fe-2S)-binding protein [Paenibacillus]MED4601882.1 (2Fe-2S)-binding protein [Paenibacillus validus]MED4606436.1 (2Fe-2S)-binding protein [Paenibacillus validus]